MSQFLHTIEPWVELTGASLWRASWQGAIAIAAAWAIARWCTFLSPRVVCWVWRLACLKLLVALFWIQPIAVPVLPANPSLNVAASDGLAEPLAAHPAFEPVAAAAPADRQIPATALLIDPQPARLLLSTWLLALWLAGVACGVAITARQWRLVHLLRRAAEPASSDLLHQACRQEAERLGVRRLPQLQITAQAESPLLAGILRPTIILPNSALHVFDAAELRVMLAHELGHLKRHDLLWNWLPMVAGWLFFFQPLVWVLMRRWSEAQEAACDELLIQNQVARPAQYGRLLLKLATHWPREPRSSLAAAGVLGAYRNLERRILAMTQVKPFSARRLTFAAGVLLLITATGIVPWRLVAQQIEPKRGPSPPSNGTFAAPTAPTDKQAADMAEAAATAVGLDPAERTALVRLRSAGAMIGDVRTGRPAPALSIIIAQGWKGTSDDLMMLGELPAIGFLTLDLDHLAGDDLSGLKLKKPIEDLNVLHATDATLAKVSELPKSNRLSFTQSKLAAEGSRQLAKLADGIKRLRIDGNYLPKSNGPLRGIDDDGLKAIGGIRSLESLEFMLLGITDAGLAHLAGLENLERLVLSMCPGVKGPGYASLAKLNALRGLSIHSMPIDAEALKALARLTQIRSLVMQPEEPITLKPADVAVLGTLVKLTGLTYMGGSRGGRESKDPGLGDALLRVAGQLPGLKVVSVQDAATGDEGLDALSKASHLEGLFLGTVRLTDRGLAAIGKLLALKHLALGGDGRVSGEGLAKLATLVHVEILSVSVKGIIDDDLPRLADLPKLEHLTLASCDVTGAGFKDPAQPWKLTSLTLNQLPIDDAGSASLPSLSTVEKLTLVNPRITDRALEDIAKMVNLREFNLGEASVTVDGLLKLGELKQLVALNLRQVKVSPTDVDQLKAALPKVQISYSGFAHWMPLGSHEGVFVPKKKDDVKAKNSKTGDKDANESTNAKNSRDPDTEADGGSKMLRELRRARAPLLASMAKDNGYGLAPGENVKRIAPPFPPIRMEYYRIGHSGQADLEPNGPQSMLFGSKDGRLEWRGMKFGSGDCDSLSGVLSSVAQLKTQMVDGPDDLLATNISGDWVIREGLASDQAVKDLEAILQKELSLPIKLEFREVERPVYVARGMYHHTPLPGQPAKEKLYLTDETIETDPIEIFGKQLVPNSGSGGGTGNYREFLDWLGRWISTPILSEVESQPKNQISWRLHGQSPQTAQTRDEDHAPQLVLPNITAQTGLTFSQETRPVKILFVEPSK